MNVGSNYDKVSKLSTTEIAKLVRADLKRDFPLYKFGVRTRYFAGGSAIDVTIKGTRKPQTIVEILKVKRGAKAILDSYNRQDINITTDYWNVRFYGSVNLDSDFADSVNFYAEVDRLRQSPEWYDLYLT